jgi:chorismate dehydratase
MTRLPFVYAVWAARADRDLDRLAAALLRAKAWGLRRLGLLASRGAVELGIPYPVALEYVTHAIRYHLGHAERAGMELFRDLAVRNGVLPQSAALRFAAEAPGLCPAALERSPTTA